MALKHAWRPGARFPPVPRPPPEDCSSWAWNTSDLLADHVLQIGIVLLADIFQRLHAGMKQDIPACVPRFGISARIFYGGFVVKDQLVHPGEAFDHMKLLGVRMPRRIQPA